MLFLAPLRRQWICQKLDTASFEEQNCTRNGQKWKWAVLAVQNMAHCNEFYSIEFVFFLTAKVTKNLISAIDFWNNFLPKNMFFGAFWSMFQHF